MSLAVRPTFEVELACPSREVIERLSAHLAAGTLQVKRTREPGSGRTAAARDHDHLLVALPTAQQRLWSPWLTIDVSPQGRGAHVHARFSPHPSVWTGFAFGYLTLGVVLLFALVFAGASAMSGGTPWPLWIAGGAALALAGLFTAAQVGKRLARAQMDALHAELDRAVAACAGPR